MSSLFYFSYRLLLAQNLIITLHWSVIQKICNHSSSIILKYLTKIGMP